MHGCYTSTKMEMKGWLGRYLTSTIPSVCIYTGSWRRIRNNRKRGIRKRLTTNKGLEATENRALPPTYTQADIDTPCQYQFELCRDCLESSVRRVCGNRRDRDVTVCQSHVLSPPDALFTGEGDYSSPSPTERYSQASYCAARVCVCVCGMADRDFNPWHLIKGPRQIFSRRRRSNPGTKNRRVSQCSSGLKFGPLG
ncbi:hypothetical protein RRG08_007933 [Elysia crispata]|uniref:Uncharacterized protein n=1 Tax=Elysia crispata TaxID=231223 RepID=A0AAE1DJW5_9GAST|nr:hypothetical protein RRG08_007933 [Elysia crispata]